MKGIEPAKGEIVMYQPDETIRLEVLVENETVWLSQAQMAELFGTKRPAITKHINNIYKCGELKEQNTCSILEHMGNDGKQLYVTKYYNLDAIISVGFRVNTKRGIEFRQWANQVLKDYEHTVPGTVWGIIANKYMFYAPKIYDFCIKSI